MYIHIYIYIYIIYTTTTTTIKQNKEKRIKNNSIEKNFLIKKIEINKYEQMNNK